MEYKLAVIPGDGIGPDVVEQTLLVLDKVGEKFSHPSTTKKVLVSGCAIDATGACLPQETIDVCKASDAVLLGAVGGLEVGHPPPATSGRNGPCWACGRPWGSSPTSAPPCSLSSWRTPPPETRDPGRRAGHRGGPGAHRRHLLRRKRALRTLTWALPPTTWSSTPRRRSAASPRWPLTWP